MCVRVCACACVLEHFFAVVAVRVVHGGDADFDGHVPSPYARYAVQPMDSAGHPNGQGGLVTGGCTTASAS